MPYCYSTDSENFTGRFSNFSEAIAESLAKTKHGDSFWIAESRQPIQPEDLWDVEREFRPACLQVEYGMSKREVGEYLEKCEKLGLMTKN